MSEKQAAVLENPNIRQFLDFLGKAEGADYNVIVGGKKFDDFSRHPNVVGLRTKEGPSTAAGKYQIVKTTYDDIAPKLGIKDFSPQSQDKIAVALIERRGALSDVLAGDWKSAIDKLGKEWASLPSSPYSQPKKDWGFVGKNLPEQVAQIPAQAVTTTGEMPVEVVSAPEMPEQEAPSKLEQLPESYRLALAANYLADTEEDSVADAALAMLEEREEAAGGGGGGPNTALQALMKRESVDPYQFILAQETGNTDQGPRRKTVPRMPQRLAEGGEVREEFDPIQALQRLERYASQQTQLGQIEQGMEDPRQRLSGPDSSALAKREYADRSLMSRMSSPMQLSGSAVSDKYGSSFGGRATYNALLSKDLAAQAYLEGHGVKPRGMPYQGAVSGAGVRLVKGFSDGGAAYAPDLTEQMTVGTLPEDQKPAGQVFRDIGQDVVRGAQYLPYDLVGGPVDVINLGLTPFGLGTEKPFLGSEYLIDKAAQAGIADRPTGSAAETATRIGMGFLNPAMVARQGARGVEALIDTAKAPIDRARIRAAASRAPEDAAYDPLRERLESEGILSLAVKPGGGVVDAGEVVDLVYGKAMNMASDMYSARTGKSLIPFTELKNTPEGQNIDAIRDWTKTKLSSYFEKQYGSPNDPVFKLFQEGKYAPVSLRKMEKEEQDILDRLNLDGDREGVTRLIYGKQLLGSQDLKEQEKGRRILSKIYDEATPIITKMPPMAIRNRLLNPQYRDSIAQYLREEKNIGLDEVSAFEMDANLDQFAKTGELPRTSQFFDTDIKEAVAANTVDSIAKQITTQGGMYGDELASNLSFNKIKGTLNPTQTENIARGEPIYQVSGLNSSLTTDFFSRNDLAKYMLNTPKEKWEKLSFPEILLQIEKTASTSIDPVEIAKRIDNYQAVTREQRFIGTSLALPLKESVIGKGVAWREITDPGGVLIEGRLLKHCLSESPSFAKQLVDGQSKYFALRDKDGKSYATIQIDRLGQDGKGPFADVRQVKGYLNAAVGDKYGKEIMDFLNDYQQKIGTKLYYTESKGYLPEELKNATSRTLAGQIDNNVAGFAKGGMVFKPLYDRAV